ncbi:Uu.00g138160.m01.CDS01 [Anthostomella pinea]|uniref:Uu.00g138160.m01.CDS01 n=1 Tax=Anthostomella pinea TaxID=933095 RepID=A0AAI8VPQ3_9PEZI|nr:Uu.00g138160.m01.CDS01 [Anthostomella pinea]
MSRAATSPSSFSEALSNTAKAKERYTEDDLYLRGAQLLASSYEQGVTSLRAFVELDHVTGTLPLTTAIRLKKDFSHLLEVQICAFAQDPIFSTTHGQTNRSIITSALDEYASSIDVLGTTPYVEESREASLQNIEWAITTASEKNLHLDFHLDYNLSTPSPSSYTPSSPPSSSPLTFAVINLLKKHEWTRVANRSKTIVLGHCTQLSVLDDAALRRLADTITASELPLHFVGLPTSDLFMMGRAGPDATCTQNRRRGTIHVPSMIKDLGLSACLGVNNVGNAFTPFGTGDPLQLASWAVGIYQAGTVADAELLYGCVSWRARQAIGLGPSTDDGEVREGQRIQGMLLIQNRSAIDLPGLTLPARQRTGFQDVVWDPPETQLRSTFMASNGCR